MWLPKIVIYVPNDNLETIDIAVYVESWPPSETVNHTSASMTEAHNRAINQVASSTSPTDMALAMMQAHKGTNTSSNILNLSGTSFASTNTNNSITSNSTNPININEFIIPEEPSDIKGDTRIPSPHGTALVEVRNPKKFPEEQMYSTITVNGALERLAGYSKVEFKQRAQTLGWKMVRREIITVGVTSYIVFVYPL
jgi:hypothetical protein